MKTTIPNKRGETLAQDVGELYEHHYELVCRTAYSISGRRQDAEDVVQTIFLKLLQSGLPDELMLNPKGYLYRAATLEAYKVIRTRQRQKIDNSVDWGSRFRFRHPNKAWTMICVEGWRTPWRN